MVHVVTISHYIYVHLDAYVCVGRTVVVGIQTFFSQVHSPSVVIWSSHKHFAFRSGCMTCRTPALRALKRSHEEACLSSPFVITSIISCLLQLISNKLNQG